MRLFKRRSVKVRSSEGNDYRFVMPMDAAERDARAIEALYHMDEQIDAFAEIFTSRLAVGEEFGTIMHGLGHRIIDDPQQWPREAITMLALRTIHRLAEAEKQANDQK